MQWYYAQNNDRKGPVEDDEIRRLAAAGVLRPDDLVWNETMGGEWRPASSVAGLFGGPPPLGAVPGTGEAGQPPRGTGGQTPNRELTARARASLSGKWGLAIGVVVTYTIVAFGLALFSSCIPFGTLIVQAIIGGPLALGLLAFGLSIARGQPAGFGQLFSGFRRFWPAIGAYALVALFILLWVLLFLLPFALWFGLVFMGQRFDWDALAQNPQVLLEIIRPYLVIFILAGIVYMVVATVVALRYSQTLFVLWDHPELGPLEAVRQGVVLMRGRKGKLFLLYLRFIGWRLLAALTCGTGYLWLMPYMFVSYAHFYDDLKS